VADPSNALESEHKHYGPYMYLEVMTWPDPGMDAHAIHGPLEKLAQLADIIEREASAASAGETRRIRSEFAPNAEYELALEMKPDGFDPASADPNGGADK